MTDLLKECTRMSSLDHPNVLTLIGVCIDGGPAPYIVMPFMFNGSLHSHLKKERSNLVISPDRELRADNVSSYYAKSGGCCASFNKWICMVVHSCG